MSGFIERSISGAVSLMKESVFADENAGKNGFLQSLDPRVKAVTFFVFIVLVVLTKNIVILTCLYVFCLVLSRLSRINTASFLKRTWIFMPVFSLFIALPALFSTFTPGEALVSFRAAGIGLTVTRQGLASAELFVMRVITSVSFAVLLNLTTRHFALLKVLRIMRIPRIFVMTAGMCYRYIYLFAEIIENTYTAIKSRVGTKVHYKKGQHIVAWNIAYLWGRSYRLNDEVYKAMLSRGYNGEPVELEYFKTGIKDWLWVVFTAVISGVVIYLGCFIKV